jgi:hypothetical protein
MSPAIRADRSRLRAYFAVTLRPRIFTLMLTSGYGSLTPSLQAERQLARTLHGEVRKKIKVKNKGLTAAVEKLFGLN